MSTQKTEWKEFYGWLVLAVSVAVVFGALGLARFGYSILLPSMQDGLGLDNAQAGGLATADLVGYLVLSVAGGLLATRFGPRIVITIGLLLTAVGMLCTGWSHSFFAAAVSRFINGLGSGASNVPVMALLAAWFARSRRGLAAGIAVSGSSLALIILGPLVPVLVSSFGDAGWRYCWFIFAAVTFCLAVLSQVVLRNHPQDVGSRMIGQENASSGVNPAGRSSSLDWSLVYTNTTIWHLGLVYAAFGFSYIIYMTFFGKYLIVEGAYSHQAAGKLFMIMGWFSLACGLLWGWVSDVIGRKGALLIVFLMHAVAFALFALWPTTPGFVLSAILFGLSAWSIPAIMSAACGDLLGSRLAPAAFGFITLFFGLGQAAGPGVAGWLADRANSLAPALLLAAAVAFAGGVGTLLLKMRKRV